MLSTHFQHIFLPKSALSESFILVLLIIFSASENFISLIHKNRLNNKCSRVMVMHVRLIE